MRLSTTWTTALVLALGAGASACGNDGGSRAADADGDRRNNVVDQCPETPPGTLTGPDGCTAGEDGDKDGLATGNDLCPGTADGATVDAYGCSVEQRDSGLGNGILYGEGSKVEPEGDDDENAPSNGSGGSGGSNGSSVNGSKSDPAAEGKALIENPPATGTVTNGYVALVIDEHSSRPFVFHTYASNLTQTDDGFEVKGAMLLATPLGELPIANASVTFAYGADESEGLKTVRGDANVPFPSFGVAQGFTADDLVKASLGFDSGENLQDLGAPLNDDRHYLFFQLSEGVSISNGPLTFSLPGGEDATLVLDPFDPFVFAAGSLLGLGSLGKIEGVRIGVSAQGLIPFRAATTRGLKDGMADFKGALYLSGSVPLTRLPFTVSGEMVLDIDPHHDGGLLSELDEAGFQLGVNGEVDLTADFLDVFSFEANVAHASAEVRVTPDDQIAWFSGVLEPDHAFLPKELPLRADYSVNVAGVLSNDIERSYLTADGKYRLSGSVLAEHLGFDLADMAVIDAHLDIDHTGFHLVGKLDAGVKLARDLELGAGATIDAKFADDADEFAIDIKGDVKVAGVSLASGHALIDQDGLHVDGKLDTGITRVKLSGEITSSGVELSGEASVTIDVVAGKDVLETVTDGAICGYEYVEDGALCGHEKVTDAAKCGGEVVTDGALCGYPYVTNGAVCGYNTVTSAAVCGTHVAESLGQCAAHEVCSWFSWTGLSCGTEYDCNVPSTCPDLTNPKTCPDMSTPKSCEDLSRPKTCDDLTQPKSCEDLSQPKTCDHHDVIPDFDFGGFEGKVAVTLGTKGVGGSVSGSYCATSSACQKLAGGSVKLGDPLEACIDIPGNLGEFCAPF